MPLIKATFARAASIDPAQFHSLALRLEKISFELGQGVKVIAVDKDYPLLTVQAVVRGEREVRRFDDQQGKMVTEPSTVDREYYFYLDMDKGVAETPGGKRSLAIFADLLRRAGAGGELELTPMFVDVAAWARAMLKMHESAELGRLVIDNFYAEPKLIGRYSAKTVDNRLDLESLQGLGGNLHSIRLDFFEAGARRTVEARTDGVLTVTCADEDEAKEFAAGQRKLYLQHSMPADSARAAGEAS
ncbi:hypothetical protein IIA79_03985 [bacterium]|nr:hypothetical protein [bacterium]